MADTLFAPSIWKAWPYESEQSTIPVRSENWQTLQIFRVERPTSEPWGCLCSFTADIDPGSVGDIRLRASAEQDMSDPARIEAFVGPVLIGINVLGWNNQNEQYVYLEGRRSGGLAGLKLAGRPALTTVSAIPSQYLATPIYPGDYTGGSGATGTYPPDYTTDPYT